MIERIFRNLAVITVISLAICHGKSEDLSTNEDAARAFLNQTSDKLFKFYDFVGDSYHLNIDGSYDQRESYRNYSIVFSKIFQDASKFDYKNFKDQELKYAFETLINELDLKILGDRFLELFDSYNEITELSGEENILDFQEKSTRMEYSSHVRLILAGSSDADELQYYWSEWRRIMGEKAGAYIDLTVDVLKEAADLTGKTPLELWLRGYNIDEMETLMNNLQPLYKELHAFVRSFLRKKYGESTIAPDGLIPDHLFRQIRLQVPKKESIIEEMYPWDDLPDLVINEILDKDLVKTVESLFVGLGFEEIISGLGKDRVMEEENKDGQCSTHSWSWTPNLYLKYCENMGYYEFTDLYSQFTFMLYAKEMVGLPAYYFNHPQHLGISIGDAIIHSATTNHNLKESGVISYRFNITEDAQMSKLLRKAFLNVLYLPMDFIHVKVMADLLAGKITKAELNSHYWKLMEKHAGVGPPKGHTTDTFDFPLIFYEELYDNDMSRDFINRALTYQIYEKLCQVAGKYPKEPLHLCEIDGSKEVGNLLKKVMQLGYSKPFGEVLKVMFPENPTVRIDGILEYYSPVKKLLAEKNKEANAKPGWKSSDK